MSNFFQGVLRSIPILSVSVTGSTVFVITVAFYCMDYDSLFTRWGTSGLFPVGAIMKETAVNICVFVFLVSIFHLWPVFFISDLGSMLRW